MQFAVLSAGIFASFVCGAAAASAHAFLDHASPAVGSAVKEAPPELRMWFTQGLEPAFSTVKVENKAGQQVDKNDKSVGPEKTLLKVSLPALPAGSYKVIWHALSVDGHATDGSFGFDVTP